MALSNEGKKAIKREIATLRERRATLLNQKQPIINVLGTDKYMDEMEAKEA